MPGIPQRRFYEHHFYFLDENLSLMSAGFLLPSPDAAVIWRGPKVRISANLPVSICSSPKILEDLGFYCRNSRTEKEKYITLSEGLQTSYFFRIIYEPRGGSMKSF
jgi:hypothetical protein